MTNIKTQTTEIPTGRELRLANAAIKLIQVLDDYDYDCDEVIAEQVKEVRDTLNEHYGRKL